jgi:hypothetical protein
MAGVIVSISFLIFFNNRELSGADAARDLYFEHRHTMTNEERIKQYLYAVEKCQNTSIDEHHFSIMPAAYAAATNDINAESVRLISISIILGTLPLFLFSAIIFSKDENVIKFAMDTIKTSLGFLTGVATSFLHIS